MIGRTCDELRTHGTEVIVRAGYAVPVAAWNAIRREAWNDGYDSGFAVCADLAQEILNSQRADAAATS